MSHIGLSRRGFLSAASASALMRGEVAGRTYHVLGVPLRSGSLYPGSENDAQAYREAQLLKSLQANGCSTIDDGDVAIPSYLPHHAIPPIRDWPGPRIAWECVRDRVAPYLRETRQVPLLIGCDCSVVVGTAQALARARKGNIHVLYVDGDFDDAAPDASRCQRAAALALWLLTNRSVFWDGPPLGPSRVTVVGWSRAAQSEHAGMGSVSLADVRRAGRRNASERVLAT